MSNKWTIQRIIQRHEKDREKFSDDEIWTREARLIRWVIESMQFTYFYTTYTKNLKAKAIARNLLREIGNEPNEAQLAAEQIEGK